MLILHLTGIPPPFLVVKKRNVEECLKPGEILSVLADDAQIHTRNRGGAAQLVEISPKQRVKS